MKYKKTLHERVKTLDDEYLLELHKIERNYEIQVLKMKNNLDVQLLKTQGELQLLQNIPLTTFQERKLITTFDEKYRDEDGKIDLDLLCEPEENEEEQ